MHASSGSGDNEDRMAPGGYVVSALCLVGCIHTQIVVCILYNLCRASVSIGRL